MSSGPRKDGESFKLYRNRLLMIEKYMRKRLKYGPIFDVQLVNELNKNKNNLDIASGGVMV